MMLAKTDTVIPMHAQPALPERSAVPMPEQSFRASSEPAALPDTGPRLIWLRRLLIFAVTIGMTIGAATEMYLVLEVGGLTIPESLVLVLFVLLFAWIALSFVSAVIGFGLTVLRPKCQLGIDPLRPLPELVSRTAILLPTYNEDPQRVLARVEAIYASLQDTGRGSHFDFFILSDTTDPSIWIEEEKAFLRLRQRTCADRIYYRHRTKNVARKAGNVGEWVTSFGGHYQHMVVLDADSLITGDTIVRLAAAMEWHPSIGLIQTLPVLLNGNTLFARIQQFAGCTYGPLIAQGTAWWHGADSNYWGHNAVIRVKAFAEHAGLPTLSGRKPFGGHILSHDFVEAALLRRAGWAVHLAPILQGSYEECPPSLTDYALRDRRWCQGNLQHLGVLGARGLHWMSRLHLLTGIGCYVTAPMWLAFLLVGMLIALQAQFIRPEYFPSGASLFPRWPAQDPIRAAWVFAGTMAMLVVPKLLGYLTMLLRQNDRRGMGGALRGLASVALETVVSALLAPVMMLMQSKAVLEILLGRDAGWQPQRRDDGTVPHSDIAKQYAVTTVLGVILTASAYAISWSLLLWMSPVLAGLVLAVPVAIATSQASIGKRVRALGLLMTPEERTPPGLLMAANGATAQAPGVDHENPLGRLVADLALRKFHFSALSTQESRKRGEIDVDYLVAMAKIADADDRIQAMSQLSKQEIFAVLTHRDALEKFLTKPCVVEGSHPL